jgi:DNA-binding Xre family transcriptional regulator
MPRPITEPTKTKRGAFEQFMKERGYSPYSLWRLTGVSQKTLLKILRGQTKKVKMDTIRRIADPLDITYADLIKLLEQDGIGIRG